MMTTLADGFASSPAGILAGIGVPILAGAIGWAIVQQLRITREFRGALNATTQALAVLVEKATNDRDDLAEVRTGVSSVTVRHADLAASVGILADRLNRHEQWAREEHNRLRDTYTSPGPRPTRRSSAPPA